MTEEQRREHLALVRACLDRGIQVDDVIEVVCDNPWFDHPKGRAIKIGFYHLIDKDALEKGPRFAVTGGTVGLVAFPYCYSENQDWSLNPGDKIRITSISQSGKSCRFVKVGWDEEEYRQTEV